MLEDIKESILNFITSRIFVLVVIFLAFFGAACYNEENRRRDAEWQS